MANHGAARPGRRRWVGPAVVVLVAVTAPIARAAEPDEPPCREDAWAAGTTEWCAGTFVYRDHVYDDNGADTRLGSRHGTPLNRATGDVDHREHGQALNSADLLALRISRTAGGAGLHVRFELNTLFATDRTVAVLAIDTDNDDATGSETIHGFGVSAPGIDEVHVFTDRRHAPTEDPFLGGVIEGDIPMPPSPAGEWDLYAFTALHDGTVMNVAFRRTESGSWWEAEQGAALADGTVAPFKGELVPAYLADGHHDPAGQRRTGFHDRVYRSPWAIGDAQEGVDYGNGHPGRTGATSFGQYFRYLGHFQPYALYVPPRTDDAYGIQLALHGYDAGHASLVSGDGMQSQLGDDLHRIVVVPLGRGPAGYYSDWSEADVLDVVADVRRTYPVDADRIFAGGYSMGGYGALRLASLHPDLFAGVISWVGFTGDCMNGTPFAAENPCPTGAVGNVMRYLDNLRHVPAANVYAAADELVHVHTANALRERFAGLGYEHVLWLHAAEHLTFAVVDDWSKEAAWTKDAVRVHDPARVTYRTNTWLDSAALGIVHDRAYWVSGIRARNTAADAVVDLLSHATGCNAGRERTRSITNGAGHVPVPWVSQASVDEGAAAIAPGAHLTGTLTNVASLTLDASSPCVTGDLSRVETDTTTVVHFTDGRQPVTLTP